MEKTIYLASTNIGQKECDALIKQLEENDFIVEEAGQTINDEDLYFLDLTNTTLAKIEEKYPWIKKELKRSNLQHLRVLPLLIYDSKKEDPFIKWENGSSIIYEDVFSEEFKPYAYDISNENSSIEELKHVLSLYYSR